MLLTDIDERKRAEDALRESERESRLIVDSIPGLVAAFTPDGEVEFVNRQVLEYFGRTLEELKRWGTADATHPEDLPRAVKHFTHSIASGDPFEFEVRARRFDGVYRWFQSRGFPLRDTNGHIVRWYNLLIDIDERKRAEEALAASERNLKLLVDTIPAPAWSARPDGSAEFFNQQYLDFMGLSAEQASDWGWTAAVHPEDMDGLAAAWQRIMASEAPGEAEARLRRQDGAYRWFLFRANPLRDEIRHHRQMVRSQHRHRRPKAGGGGTQAGATTVSPTPRRLSKTGSFITDLRRATTTIGPTRPSASSSSNPRTKVTVQRIRDIIHPDDLPSFDSVIARGYVAGVDVKFCLPNRDLPRRREACARRRPCHRADRGSTDVRRRPSGRDREHGRGGGPEQGPFRARPCGAGHDLEHVDRLDRS